MKIYVQDKMGLSIKIVAIQLTFCVIGYAIKYFVIDAHDRYTLQLFTVIIAGVSLITLVVLMLLNSSLVTERRDNE